MWTATESLRWTATALLALIAFVIVGVLRIGPVILVLSPTHGVHSGDSLAALPALACWFVRPRNLAVLWQRRKVRVA